jgi:hypothetical protein
MHVVCVELLAVLSTSRYDDLSNALSRSQGAPLGE